MRYYIADLHLGHQKIAALRGFDSVEAHDTAILRSLGGFTAADQLWILGDICSGTKRSAEEALSALHGMVCGLHLVAGNHDPVHPMHRDAHRWQSRFLQVFDSVQVFARHRIDGTSVLLSHFPYQGGGDHTEEERHTQYRLPDLGEWLIHGHTHSYLANSGPRSFCVSAEACIDGIPSEADIATAMTNELSEVPNGA